MTDLEFYLNHSNAEYYLTYFYAHMYFYDLTPFSFGT